MDQTDDNYGRRRLASIATTLTPTVIDTTPFTHAAECNTAFYSLAVVSTSPESISTAIQFNTGVRVVDSVIVDQPLTSVESIFAGCIYNHPEQSHYPACANGSQCIGVFVRDEATQAPMGQPLRAFQYEGALPHRIFNEGSTPAPSPGLCILCLFDVQPLIHGLNYPGARQQICVNDDRISRTRLAEGPSGLFPTNLQSKYTVGFLMGVQQRDVFGTNAKQIARLLNIPDQPLYLTYPHSGAHTVFYEFLTRLQSVECELARLLRIVISACIENTLPRHTIRDATEMRQTHEFSNMYSVPAMMDCVVLELHMNTVAKSPVTTAFMQLLNHPTKKHTCDELQCILASEKDAGVFHTDCQLAYMALDRALKRNPHIRKLNIRRVPDHTLFTDHEKWAALAIHATQSTDCVWGVVTPGIVNALRARHTWRCTNSPVSLLADNMLCISCLKLNPPVEYGMTGDAVCTFCNISSTILLVTHRRLEATTSHPIKREPALTCAVHGCRRIRSARAAYVIFRPAQADGIPTVVCPEHKSEYGWIGRVPRQFERHHTRLFLSRKSYYPPRA